MDLQYALLLFGVIVIAVVALSAYDKVRRGRSAQRPPREEGKVHEPHISFDTPVRADGGNKFLKSDADIELPEKTQQDILRRELKNLEETATMPLNLAASLRRSGRRKPDAGQPSMPDEKIDFIIHLPGAGPVARNAALGVFKQHEYRLNKPRRLYGLRYQTDRWSELQLDRESIEYGDIALSIQLVDPRGPIDESEINTFMQLGLQLADALMRPTQLPLSFEQALARAQELQQFCETYDVIAGVNVVPKVDAAFTGRAIDMAARKLGLQLGVKNMFHMKNEVSPGAPTLFSLTNLGAAGGFKPDAWDTFVAPGLALSMSVPCTYQPAATFEKMLSTAKEACEILGGRLQDQDGRPLTDKGVAVIRHQIEDIGEKMRAYGIAPGSTTALKLFNEAPTP